jgi:hypothetical protein
MVTLSSVAQQTKTDTAGVFDTIIIGAGVPGLYQRAWPE